MHRLLAAVYTGYASFALAVGVGIPVWSKWPSWQMPADATDIGVLIGLSVLHTAHRQPPPPTKADSEGEG
jgi:hypothetical protein